MATNEERELGLAAIAAMRAANPKLARAHDDGDDEASDEREPVAASTR